MQGADLDAGILDLALRLDLVALVKDAIQDVLFAGVAECLFNCGGIVRYGEVSK